MKLDKTFMCAYSQLSADFTLRNKVLFVSGCNRKSLQVVGKLIQKVHSCGLASLNFFKWF